MDEEGVEPPKPEGDRFTVCPLCTTCILILMYVILTHLLICVRNNVLTFNIVT